MGMMSMAFMRLVVTLLLVLPLTSCLQDLTRDEAPRDRVFFPSGLAQSGEFLVLSSTNAALRYESGAMVALDLQKIDAGLSTPSSETVKFGKEAIASIIGAPSFGTQPLIVDSNTLLATGRAESKLFSMPFTQGLLSGTSADIDIGFAPYFMQIFHRPNLSSVVFVAGLTSDKILVIDPQSMKIVNTIELSGLVTQEDGKGRPKKNPAQITVSGLKILLSPPPPAAPREPMLFIGCSLYDHREVRFIEAKSAQLLWVPINEALISGTVDNNTVSSFSFDKNKHMGKEIHGFSISPDLNELYVVLHRPDSLARIDFTKYKQPNVPILTGVVPTCHYPMDVAVSSTLVYVACFTEAIAAYDRLSLDQLHVNRDLGRGPTSLLLDSRPGKTRLYVSYYLDSTIGIFSDDLVPLGSIFEPIPENQDGGM